MSGFKRFWAETWLSEARGARPPRWTLPLHLLEPVVRGVIRGRANEFDREPSRARARLPVVSVGNLTIGGTNKTPTVDWLLTRLAASSRRLGVATRGYGRSGPAVTFRGADLPDLTGSREDLGDEPRLLASHHPDVWVAIDPDRVSGVESLAERGVEWVVADDAFQHRRLARAFDLVLVDSSCPWGNGHLLPAGILREPPSALTRASAVFLTRATDVGADEVERLRRQVEAWVPAERVHLAHLEVSRWMNLGSTDGAPTLIATGEAEQDRPAARIGGPAFVVTGIAKPESLVRTVESEAMNVVGMRSFRDHAKIGKEPFLRAVEEARRRGASVLVSSEKDVPNLPPEAVDASSLPIWVPRVEMSVERGEDVVERIVASLSGGVGHGA
ncbi:MAG: tetraacyldisaccharide 4'-kinase [Candidatus Eisenbacteria bacterium]